MRFSKVPIQISLWTLGTLRPILFSKFSHSMKGWFRMMVSYDNVIEDSDRNFRYDFASATEAAPSLYFHGLVRL